MCKFCLSVSNYSTRKVKTNTRRWLVSEFQQPYIRHKSLSKADVSRWSKEDLYMERETQQIRIKCRGMQCKSHLRDRLPPRVKPPDALTSTPTHPKIATDKSAAFWRVFLPSSLHWKNSILPLFCFFSPSLLFASLGVSPTPPSALLPFVLLHCEPGAAVLGSPAEQLQLNPASQKMLCTSLYYCVRGILRFYQYMSNKPRHV